jgi:hypothetical protein
MKEENSISEIAAEELVEKEKADVEEKINKLLGGKEKDDKFVLDIDEKDPKEALKKLGLVKKALKENLQKHGDLNERGVWHTIASFLPFVGSWKVRNQNKMVRVSELYDRISEKTLEVAENVYDKMNSMEKQIQSLTNNVKELTQGQEKLLGYLSQQKEKEQEKDKEMKEMKEMIKAIYSSQNNGQKNNFAEREMMNRRMSDSEEQQQRR